MLWCWNQVNNWRPVALQMEDCFTGCHQISLYHCPKCPWSYDKYVTKCNFVSLITNLWSKSQYSTTKAYLKKITLWIIKNLLSDIVFNFNKYFRLFYFFNIIIYKIQCLLWHPSQACSHIMSICMLFSNIWNKNTNLYGEFFPFSHFSSELLSNELSSWPIWP